MFDLTQIIKNPKIIENIHGINLEDSLVFIAGSVTEGFGNPKSDIDVYVIHQQIDEKLISDRAALNGDSLIFFNQHVIHNLELDNIRFDYEYWDWKQFNMAIQRLNQLDFNVEDFLPCLSEEEYDILHRFKYAKPLINESRFEQIYHTVKFENLGLYWASLQSRLYGAHKEDLEGAILSGDYGTAFFISRRLIDLFTTMYLALHGETNPNPKWLYRKLCRYRDTTGDTTLLNKYLELQSHPYDPDSNSLRKFIKNSLRFCEELNITVQNILNTAQNQSKVQK